MAPNSGRRVKRPPPDDLGDDSNPDHDNSQGDYESESSRRSRPRRRTEGDDSSSEEDVDMTSQAPMQNGSSSLSRRMGALRSDRDHQPGAVVRVSVTNFGTYSKGDFFPGPYLNMVIGPNGTGKSTLGRALCIGLAFSHKLLANADTVSAFVKNGEEVATIEVELKRLAHERTNPTIKVKLNRNNNSQKFWLNGKETPMKKIQGLAKNLNIQIDNVCQFLPQERVVEFSKLSEVDLLDEMLRAAASPRVLNGHRQLKEQYEHQDTLKKTVTQDEARLEKLNLSLRSMQQDVDKFRDREEALRRIELLRAAVVAARYTEAVESAKEAKAVAKRAQAKVQALEKENEPTLQRVTDLESYRDQVAAAVEYRKATLHEAEAEGERLLATVVELEKDIEKRETQMQSQTQMFKSKKKAVAEIKTKITKLEAQQKGKPPKFDAAEWNTKIRAEERKERDLAQQSATLSDTIQGLDEQWNSAKVQAHKLLREKDAMATRQGQLEKQLRALDRDAFEGWKWLKEHQDEFEKEVFGPPLLTCSMKDERYAGLVQSMLANKDMTCFTVQTNADRKKLSNQFFGSMGLSVSLRTFAGTLDEFKPPVRAQDLGFDGFAIDYLDGPPLLLSQFCANNGLHKSGVALRDLSEEQYDKLSRQDFVNSWAAGKTFYKKVHRKEYGDAGRSTTTRDVGPARYWKDQAVDTGDSEQINQDIAKFHADGNRIKAERVKAETEREAILEEQEAQQKSIDALKKEKSALQTQHTQFQSLPRQIEAEKKDLRLALEAMHETRAEHNELASQKRQCTVRQLEAALAHRDQLAAIHAAHEALVEAQMVHIQAKSDVKGLQARCRVIIEQCEAEKENQQRAQQRFARLKDEARGFKDELSEINAEKSPEFRQEYASLASGKTGEQLASDIEAEETTIEALNFPVDTMQRYNQANQDLGATQRRLDRDRGKIATIQGDVDELRGWWEPQVDKLVSNVNNNFRASFEGISCMGEVQLHKDADFSKWSIKLMVAFRPDSEGLSQLDNHKQSGGERAVTTAFFILALQGEAKTPFTLVDEINQGMDARNERMVHSRMVDIACRDHQSQLFVVTPKLLQGLRYHEGVTVLVIANGTGMPGAPDRLNFANLLARQKAILAAA